MTILLTVLKIIGIVLLVLLCLLLAVVLLVLFVPIRYRADGAYQEKPEVRAEVTWLLHLLCIRAAYDDSLSYSVRVAGFRLLPKKDKPAAPANAEEAAGALSNAEEAAGVPANTEGAAGASAAPPEPPYKTPEEEAPKGEVQTDETSKDAVPENETANQAAREDIAEEAQSLTDKIYDFFTKLQDKRDEICDKIKNIRETVFHYLSILEREETKRTIGLVLLQLQKILKHVLPRKLDVRFVIGTGDPASTGQIMALQGMFYPLLKDRVQIIPDFEDKHVEGTFHIKGRITVICLLLCALRVIISKNFRRLIRLLRKKEEA